jgi:hypothetical protein
MKDNHGRWLDDDVHHIRAGWRSSQFALALIMDIIVRPVTPRCFRPARAPLNGDRPEPESVVSALPLPAISGYTKHAGAMLRHAFSA